MQISRVILTLLLLIFITKCHQQLTANPTNQIKNFVYEIPQEKIEISINAQHYSIILYDKAQDTPETTRNLQEINQIYQEIEPLYPDIKFFKVNIQDPLTHKTNSSTQALIDTFISKYDELPIYDLFIRGYPIRYYSKRKSPEDQTNWIKETIEQEPQVLSFKECELLDKRKSGQDRNYIAIFYTKNQAMRKNLSILNKKLPDIKIYSIEDEKLAKTYMKFNTSTGEAMKAENSQLVLRVHDNLRKFYNGPIDDIRLMEKFIVDNQYPDIVYLTKDSYRWLINEKIPYITYITSSFQKDSEVIELLKKNSRKYKRNMLMVQVENNNRWSRSFAEANGVYDEIMPCLILVESNAQIYSGHARAIYGGEAGFMSKVKPIITQAGIENFVDKWQEDKYESFYKSDIGIRNSEDSNMKVLTGRNFQQYILEDFHSFNVVYFYNSKSKWDQHLLKRFMSFSESSTQISYLKFGHFDTYYNELPMWEPIESCVILFNQEFIKPFTNPITWSSEEDIMNLLIPNLNADLEKRKLGYHKWYYPLEEYDSKNLTNKIKKNYTHVRKVESKKTVHRNLGLPQPVARPPIRNKWATPNLKTSDQDL